MGTHGLDSLLTVAEAATALGLKPSTIRKMILQRRLDVVRPTSRAVRIPLSGIRRILDRGYRPAVNDGSIKQDTGGKGLPRELEKDVKTPLR